MLQLPQSRPRRYSLFVIAILFLLAGANHFLNPDFYLRIMPPYLPAHLELIYLSGLFEMLGGVGILVPGIRRLSSWGLAALLLAVLPANVHMALNPEQFPSIPIAALYARLPFQFVLIAWVIWAARRGNPQP